MKYKFYRFKDIKAERWVLEISTIEMLMDYHEKYFSVIVKNHLKESQKIGNEGKSIHDIENWSTSFGRGVAALSRGSSMMNAMVHVEHESLKTKMEFLRKSGKIYCEENYTFFTKDDTEELVVIETRKRDSMIYPQYSSKDIDIHKWQEDGKHYYAKIGSFDVVVNGKQSWNTPEEAKRNALTFLKDEIDGD